MWCMQIYTYLWTFTVLSKTDNQLNWDVCEQNASGGFRPGSAVLWQMEQTLENLLAATMLLITQFEV